MWLRIVYLLVQPGLISENPQMVVEAPSYFVSLVGVRRPSPASRYQPEPRTWGRVHLSGGSRSQASRARRHPAHPRLSPPSASQCGQLRIGLEAEPRRARPDRISDITRREMAIMLLDHSRSEWPRFFATTRAARRSSFQGRRRARATTFSSPLDAQNASHAAISSRRRSSASDLR